MPSANGKGRTLFEILTGRNSKDMRPLEFQYHNPLGAKIGCTISFDHEESLSGINFVVEKIVVYKTTISDKNYYHTDYCLKGMSLESDGYIRLKLRLTPDENVTNKIGHNIQILKLYEEMQWDEDLYNMLCENGCYDENYDDEGTTSFKVNYDLSGNEMEHPWQYWRIGGCNLDPYNATVTVLSDVDGDGTVEDEELERHDVVYWDFSRLTEQNSVEITEFFTVEMEEESRFFTMYIGTEIEAFQISVF